MVVMRFSNGSDYDPMANDHIFLTEILSQLHYTRAMDQG